HDREAERSLLACALTAGSIPLAAQSLEAGDFSLPLHTHVWAAMQRLADRRIAFEPLTMKQVLLGVEGAPAHEQAEANLTPLRYLQPKSEKVPDYVRAIKDTARRRQMRLMSLRIVRGLQVDPPNTAQVLAQMEKLATALRDGTATQTVGG